MLPQNGAVIPAKAGIQPLECATISQGPGPNCICGNSEQPRSGSREMFPQMQFGPGPCAEGQGPCTEGTCSKLKCHTPRLDSRLRE